MREFLPHAREKQKNLVTQENFFHTRVIVREERKMKESVIKREKRERKEGEEWEKDGGKGERLKHQIFFF